MSSRTLKRTVVVAMCVGVLGGVGVTSAYAGEITGKGRTLEVVVPEGGGDPVVHGKSITAYTLVRDGHTTVLQADAKAFGADYLVKPIETADLLALIGKRLAAVETPDVSAPPNLDAGDRASSC